MRCGIKVNVVLGLNVKKGSLLPLQIRRRQYRFLMLCLVVAMPLVARADVSLSLLADVDISNFSALATDPNYIGSNPSALAWDGSTAWIGGYNASGVVGTTAINTVSNVLTTPTLGTTAFGILATTNNTRGITGLALQGTNLGVGLDNGGGSGDSVRLFNTTTSTQTWRIGDATAGNDSTRRGNGVAFDPGFNGAGTNQGLAYLSIGSGRRHLLNTASGVYINGQNAGGIINFAPTSTTWRDLAFDPVTGDMYTRESNRIGKAIRNGDNTFTSATSTAIGDWQLRLQLTIKISSLLMPGGP